MAPPSRKRRAPADDDTPAETQNTHRNRRRQSSSDEEVDFDDIDERANSADSTAQLAKNLVRYALACEYARIPIKRQDVSQKVLGSRSREFKQIFDRANSQLLDTFGMEMVELPNKEKTTIRQKRAAAASESQSKNSNQWVLCNALPDTFRIPAILSPPQIPTSENESAYVGLYTMIIALISLSGGTLSEGKLDRFLKRMNADQSTPVDTRDEVLKRMAKEGYIVKVKDTSSGEDLTDYLVGPRGKVEVGEEAVANMVRTVFSGAAIDDLDQRLNRSLGITDGSMAREPAVNADGAATQGGGRRAPGRPRRRRDDDEDEV